MNASATITDPLLRRSAGGLVFRTLTVRLETGALLFLAPVSVLEAGQVLPQTAEPVPWAPRAVLATCRRDFATDRHD
jgi:hypothetical protein